jgi:hypothetical protein
MFSYTFNGKMKRFLNIPPLCGNRCLPISMITGTYGHTAYDATIVSLLGAYTEDAYRNSEDYTMQLIAEYDFAGKARDLL